MRTEVVGMDLAGHIVGVHVETTYMFANILYGAKRLGSRSESVNTLGGYRKWVTGSSRSHFKIIWNAIVVCGS
jgi:hypothetical protein